MKFAGPALTVEVRPGDNLMIHAAMAIAKPGDVIVIDGKGDLVERADGRDHDDSSAWRSASPAS